MGPGVTADTLLARLVPKVTAPETAATLAMEYILSSLPEVAQGLVDAVADRVAIERFDVGRIVAEASEGGTRPDLKVHDADGKVRLLIENKFWAGLTEAQPVRYLELLPEDVPSTLLFVVPRARVPGVWQELKHKCCQHGNGIELTDERAADGFARIRTGARALAVTSWCYVMDTLTQIAQSGAHRAVEADVAQLRGLTDRMSNEGVFLPLREETAGDVRVAQRMNNYIDLIDPIVNKLVHHHGFSTKDLGKTNRWKSPGHYFCAHNVIGAWIGIRYDVWCRHGVSPLWWRSGPNHEFSGFQGKIRDAEMLFDDAVVWNNESELLIPIRLAIGVEKDRVIQKAVTRIEEIAHRLKEALVEAVPPE